MFAIVSTVCELAGFAALATAALLLAGPPACLIVGGLELLLAGFALSPDVRAAAGRPKRAKRT